LVPLVSSPFISRTLARLVGIVLDTVGLVAPAVVMTGSEDLIRGGMDRQQGWAG
jgi:hypothetical protein